MKIQNESEPLKIENFIQSVLILKGLKKNKDFKVSGNQLWIKKNPLRGQLISVLKDLYPEFNYYWDTPQILRWF